MKPFSRTTAGGLAGLLAAATLSAGETGSASSLPVHRSVFQTITVPWEAPPPGGPGLRSTAPAGSRQESTGKPSGSNGESAVEVTPTPTPAPTQEPGPTAGGDEPVDPAGPPAPGADAEPEPTPAPSPRPDDVPTTEHPPDTDGDSSQDIEESPPPDPVEDEPAGEDAP